MAAVKERPTARGDRPADETARCSPSGTCGCATARPTSSTGCRSPPGRARSLALLGPNGAGKTTTIEILEGFRMRSAGEVSVLGVDPAHGDERWRARLGVVLQSWRDHGKVAGPRAARPPRHVLRRLLDADRIRRPWDTDELIAAVGLTAHAQQAGRPALRRPAAPARRGHRHRRPARAAVPRRADGRLRPGGAARVPRPGAPAGRHRRHHDPAHHPRPRRGREAGRPDPHPGRRRGSSRTARPTSCPGRCPPRPRCAGPRGGERFVHAAADATAFVRELFRQHGDGITDLEVRRASLEDTYMALVRDFESGRERSRACRRVRGVTR